MCSPTHNAAAITTDYPPANFPRNELATQMPRATFSACSPTCSPPTAPRATDRLAVPSQSNRDRRRTRDPMQIKSLATYLKTYVTHPLTFHPPTKTAQPLPPFFFCFTLLYTVKLLRPEVERHLPLWTWLGAACGAGLGFITANVPGLVVGAYAGNRLGAIRDAKGKSVAAVFSELGASQKVEVRGTRVSGPPASWAPVLLQF
jgi:hypothetical protein